MSALRDVDSVPGLPARQPDAHKGSCGTVLVVAGNPGMLGAAILTARGALRGGAGLVRTALPGPSRDAFTVAVPASTTLDRDALDAAALLDGSTAAVIGPGLGQHPATAELVRALLVARGRRPLVLDADALNLLAPLPGTGNAGLAHCILTPHPGEAGRLLGSSAHAVQADRRGAVAALAARSAGVVLLKGAGTLVCDGARLYTNRSGNPGLATGGSGDVLSGLLGALLAQGMTPFDAACLGAHVHGRAGDRVAARLSPSGLCAEDLPLAIAAELADA